MLSYHQISAVGQYEGYQPSDNGWEETDSVNATFVNPAEGIYMYGSRNATGVGIQGRTYAIVRGNYTNGETGQTFNDRYYKLDIIYKDEDGTANFYNILRNFHFRIIIQSVTFEGYASAAEAARAPATNNISASVQAQQVNNISDGSARRLFLNDLYFLFTEGGASDGDILTKFYGFTDAAAGTTGWRNHIIEVSVLPGSDDIFTVQPAVASGTMDEDNWSHVTFTLKEPTATPQTATLRFFARGYDRFETLYRDVTVVLRKPYEMIVDCQDVVPANTDQPMFVNLLVPDGLNSMLFPLNFYVEGQQKSVYPNASQNQLPVHIGSSIVSGNSGNSFQFEKTVTATDYSAATTKVVDGVTYRVIPLYFKTNVAASATTIYAANEYFTTASGSFQNGNPMFPEGDNMKVTIIPSDYYGAGNSFTYVTFLTVRNSGTATLTLKEGDQTWSQNINLAATTTTYAVQHSSVNNGDGTYTHTVRIPTQTFSSNSYEATVEPYGEGFTQEFSTTATLARHYIYIPVGSFETNVGTSGYDNIERFRSYTAGVNTGRLNFTANGTTEVGNRTVVRTDGGFTWADGTGYHIYDTNILAAGQTITEATEIRFFDPSTRHNTTYDGDNYVTGWEARVTVGELTSRHAVDLRAGATEATGTTVGLYKWQLTFAQP